MPWPVVLLERFGDAPGGAQQVLIDLLDHMEDDFAPSVVVLRGGWLDEECRRRGVPVVVTGGDPAPSRRALLRAAGTLRRSCRRAALVHANGNSCLVAAGAATIGRRTPIVWHVHDPQSTSGARQRRLVAIQGRCRPAELIATTPEVRSSLMAAYPRLPPPTLIPPGVEIPAEPPDRSTALARLGDGSGRPLLVMLARMIPGKGHPVLIEAMADVARTHPEVRLAITGRADAPPYEREVVEAIEQRGLADHIVLEGYVSQDRRNDLVAAASAVVHPASFEPFGLACAEGMAASRCVIALRTAAGPSALIDDGRTGILADPDPSSIADAIRSVLDDPAAADEMGARAALEIRQGYSVTTMAAAIQDRWRRWLTPARCEG